MGVQVHNSEILQRQIRKAFWEVSSVQTALLSNLALVFTTQVNSTFRARWLASSEVISQVLFPSEKPKKYKIVFAGILSQIKLLFGPLVIQLVWYILKQLFTSVSVEVVGIYLYWPVNNIVNYGAFLKEIIVIGLHSGHTDTFSYNAYFGFINKTKLS